MSSNWVTDISHWLSMNQNTASPPMARLLAAQTTSRQMSHDRYSGILCCCCDLSEIISCYFFTVQVHCHHRTPLHWILLERCVSFARSPAQWMLWQGTLPCVILALFAQVLDGFRAWIHGWCECPGGLLWLTDSAGRWMLSKLNPL